MTARDAPGARAPRAHLALGAWALGLVSAVVLVAGALAAAPAEDSERGAVLYRRYCAVCHGLEGRGDGPNAAFLDDDRPRDLTDAKYIGGLSDERLVRVIAGGGQAIQGSRFMPPWGRTLAPGQLHDLVAYVRRLASGVPAPARPATERSAGAGLVTTLGCATCHRMGDLEPTPVGPDLSDAGNRVRQAWLVRFLATPGTIRPVGYHPLSGSRMPDFRLSDGEAADLAQYLMTRRQPHSVGGAEPMAPIEVAERGRDLIRSYACRACHRLGGAGGRAGPDLSTVPERLSPGWVTRFLQDPQATDPLTPMPNLGLTANEARAITRYLVGESPPAEDPPPAADAAARGLALFQALGCQGCHARGSDPRPPRVGPDLSLAGDKFQPDWLVAFLRQPSAIRPGFPARMPGFRLSEAETGAIGQFLAGLGVRPGALPERLRFRGAITEVEAGRRLASREVLSCGSCHLGDGPLEGTPDEWAPDFRISARRLQPDWIVRWLLDPQRLAAGTKMPTYFSDATSGPEAILDGDEERQILALRDYILSLRSADTPDAPGRTP
jgi:mono/diheme cytochrome c family protein